ncbi:MAG TPA: hypothetical protein PK563_15965, partial [Tenuifilaceae bacterium]|nr:hypothetical protein [Tenuifilaceae bacterium]
PNLITMTPFEKVNTLLNSMEHLINEEKFDIDNSECAALNNQIVSELERLEFDQGNRSAYQKAQKRFKRLWNIYEPIEDDERSVRDMMFPEGEND